MLPGYMSLLTIERGVSPEDEVEDDVLDDLEFEEPPSPIRRGRSQSYFAVGGTALFLHRSEFIHMQQANADKDGIQPDLCSMIRLLEPEDTMRVAVKLESTKPEHRRYMGVVSHSNPDVSETGFTVMGFDCLDVSDATIGLVLPLYADTDIQLDGDGGFSLSSDRNYLFKPDSVQALWLVLQCLYRARNEALTLKCYTKRRCPYWIGIYKERISSPSNCISQWLAMEDLMSYRCHSPVVFCSPDGLKSVTQRHLSSKLREIMVAVDLDTVTSKYLRTKLQEVLEFDLTSYKGYIDEMVITILGQMDSPSQILDFLFLGSEWNASDLDDLKANGIGYILNITKEIDNFFPSHFVYKNIRVYDEESTDLLPFFRSDEAYNFILSAKENNSKCFVHCKMGVSRSASMVIAFLMKYNGWSLNEAKDFVKQCRSCINPNPSFMSQLSTYEGILSASRRRDVYEKRETFPLATESLPSQPKSRTSLPSSFRSPSDENSSVDNLPTSDCNVESMEVFDSNNHNEPKELEDTGSSIELVDKQVPSGKRQSSPTCSTSLCVLSRESDSDNGQLSLVDENSRALVTESDTDVREFVDVESVPSSAKIRADDSWIRPIDPASPPSAAIECDVCPLENEDSIDNLQLKNDLLVNEIDVTKLVPDAVVGSVSDVSTLSGRVRRIRDSIERPSDQLLILPPASSSTDEIDPFLSPTTLIRSSSFRLPTKNLFVPFSEQNCRRVASTTDLPSPSSAGDSLLNDLPDVIQIGHVKHRSAELDSYQQPCKPFNVPHSSMLTPPHSPTQPQSLSESVVVKSTPTVASSTADYEYGNTCSTTAHTCPPSSDDVNVVSLSEVENTVTRDILDDIADRELWLSERSLTMDAKTLRFIREVGSSLSHSSSHSDDISETGERTVCAGLVRRLARAIESGHLEDLHRLRYATEEDMLRGSKENEDVDENDNNSFKPIVAQSINNLHILAKSDSLDNQYDRIPPTADNCFEENVDDASSKPSTVKRRISAFEQSDTEISAFGSNANRRSFHSVGELRKLKPTCTINFDANQSVEEKQVAANMSCSDSEVKAIVDERSDDSTDLNSKKTFGPSHTLAIIAAS